MLLIERCEKDEDRAELDRSIYPPVFEAIDPEDDPFADIAPGFKPPWAS